MALDPHVQAQADALDRASGWTIFQRRTGPGGYKFVCPGVMLGEDDVDVKLEGGQWVLSYVDGDRTYTGRADDQVAAYLALIADRYGLIGTFTAKPEEVRRDAS